MKESFEVVNVSGVRESGAAAADEGRDRMLLTIRGSNEPHGVFRFESSSLHTSVNASNESLSLDVVRLHGNIG